MTEDQIERIVASRTDRLDDRYLNTGMAETEYNAALRKIDVWAERQYATRRLYSSTEPQE